MNAKSNSEHFIFTAGQKAVAALLIIVGAVAIGISFKTDPERTWVNLLLNNIYFIFIAVAGVFFVALQYVSSAGWSAVLRRVPEAMMSYLPVGAVLMLTTLYFGAPTLYEWMHTDVVAHDPILSSKVAFLNAKWFYIRAIIYFALWIFFARLLRKNSLAQDVDGNIGHYNRNLKVSAIFIAVFAFTVAFASFDWLMSLEPHWYSTIFGVYAFSGLFVSGNVAIALILLYLLKQGYFKGEVTVNHLHDMGKFVFAFSIFWAYIWFSQFMLIWYANLPEEVGYYTLRLEGGWRCLFYVNVAANWLFPFFALMTRNAKRSPKVLAFVCLGMLAAHWLDLFLMIAPSVYHKRESIPFGWVEILSFLGFGGLFVFTVGSALSRATLVPVRDPFLEESLHHAQ